MSNNIIRAIKGNIKREAAGCNINVYVTEDEFDKLTEICAETGMQRNKYVGEALRHYWKCKTVKH